MLIWQKMMIALARSPRVTGYMQTARWTRPFSRRFVGGDSIAEGLATARALWRAGIETSLFSLGEYVDAAEGAAEHVATLKVLMPLLDRNRMHVSIDPTQIGAMQSWSVCRTNAFALATAMAAHADESTTPPPALMLDMEDGSTTGETLALYHALRDANLPAAVTVQAYLHRTATDIDRLIERGGFVRLVKGAFAEPAVIAATSRTGRDERFKAAVDRLFSPVARARGVYPALGTHDHRMIDYARRVAAREKWPGDKWEVEMLYGVRPAYQRQLLAEGVRVRLYLPFGRDWWPYSIRRVGETPRNLWFVARAAADRNVERH